MTLIRRPGLLLTVAVLITLIAATCTGDDQASPTPTQAAANTVPANATQAPLPPAPAASATPPPERVGDEPVAFATNDGVTLRGHMYASSGPRRKVVVLAHMNGSDQRAWAGFAQELAGQGIAALTFDFRGFGETGGSPAPIRADADLEAAVRFIASRDYAQVYVVGAWAGRLPLKVAARQNLAGVVAISAPATFMGLDAQGDVSLVSEPKLFLASRNDPNQAAMSLATLLAAGPPPKESELYDGAAHGTELLQNPAAKARIVAFLGR